MEKNEKTEYLDGIQKNNILSTYIKANGAGMVLYFCVGYYDEVGQFNGLIQGYEGGGRFNEKLVFRNKLLPDKLDDRIIDWSEAVGMFESLTSIYLKQLTTAVKEFIKFNALKSQWEIIPDVSCLFKKGVFSERMQDTPPAFGLTQTEGLTLNVWSQKDLYVMMRGKKNDKNIR